METCLKKQVLWNKSTGQELEEAYHQLTELPRALVEENGLPVKGNKSNVTKSYTNRYGDQIVSEKLPARWNATTVIIDGMFLIHIAPQSQHATIDHYCNMLAKHHILPYFSAGALEVHLIFDSLHHQKQRRDREGIRVPMLTIHTTTLGNNYQTPRSGRQQWSAQSVNINWPCNLHLRCCSKSPNTCYQISDSSLQELLRKIFVTKPSVWVMVLAKHTFYHT